MRLVLCVSFSQWESSNINLIWSKILNQPPAWKIQISFCSWCAHGFPSSFYNIGYHLKVNSLKFIMIQDGILWVHDCRLSERSTDEIWIQPYNNIVTKSLQPHQCTYSTSSNQAFIFFRLFTSMTWKVPGSQRTFLVKKINKGIPISYVIEITLTSPYALKIQSLQKWSQLDTPGNYKVRR